MRNVAISRIHRQRDFGRTDEGAYSPRRGKKRHWIGAVAAEPRKAHRDTPSKKCPRYLDIPAMCRPLEETSGDCNTSLLVRSYFSGRSGFWGGTNFLISRPIRRSAS